MNLIVICEPADEPRLFVYSRSVLPQHFNGIKPLVNWALRIIIFVFISIPIINSKRSPKFIIRRNLQQLFQFDIIKKTINHEEQEMSTTHFRIIAKIAHNEVQLTSSTGYKSCIDMKDPLTFDSAISACNEAIEELRFEPVDSDIIFELIRRSLGEPLPRHVTDFAVSFVFQKLHRLQNVLKLSYDKLMEDWAVLFMSDASKGPVRRLPNGTIEKVLRVKGSAFPLVLEILSKFGNLSPRFTEKKAMDVLKKHARTRRSYVTCDEFCSATKECIQRMTRVTRRLSFSIPRLSFDRLARIDNNYAAL